MTGYIYRHTNLLNGKIYIGQTIQDPKKRWGKDGSNYKHQTYFYRDILKYGWENFKHEVIASAEIKNKKLLRKELIKLEANYILEYNSMVPTKGYNTYIQAYGFNTSLSIPAKRIINKFIAEGHTFEEAYEIYKTQKQKGRILKNESKVS